MKQPKIGDLVSYEFNNSWDLSVPDSGAYSGVCTERMVSYDVRTGEVTEIEQVNKMTILTVTLDDYPFVEQIKSSDVQEILS